MQVSVYISIRFSRISRTACFLTNAAAQYQGMAQKLQQQMTISRNTRTQKKDFSCSFPVLLTLELICRQSECKQELCIRIQNLSIVVKSSRVLCCVMQCHFLTNYQMTSVQQQHCSLSDDHPRIYLTYLVVLLCCYISTILWLFQTNGIYTLG